MNDALHLLGIVLVLKSSFTLLTWPLAFNKLKWNPVGTQSFIATTLPNCIFYLFGCNISHRHLATHHLKRCKPCIHLHTKHQMENIIIIFNKYTNTFNPRWMSTQNPINHNTLDRLFMPSLFQQTMEMFWFFIPLHISSNPPFCAISNLSWFSISSTFF